jgi:hypothetical protein
MTSPRITTTSSARVLITGSLDGYAPPYA